MTQLEQAKKGNITKEMEYIAKNEAIDGNVLRKNVAKGFVVIPANKNHKNLKPIGIGKDLTVKVNANIGASPDKPSLREELKKVKNTLEAKADAVMDLTILKDSIYIDKIRRAIIKKCSVPLGTVPIYQAAIEAGSPENLTIKKYLEVFEKQARDGVDFATVHAGITKASLSLVKKRLMPTVSRGGSFILRWMTKQNKESFLYQYFDQILEIAKEYDVTLSLGDGLRPGCITDETDQSQLYELKVLGELAQRSKEKEVQVMIEGPGHIPLNNIEKNVELEKEICKGSPFYVLGPLPTDIAAGYDQIAGAIGAALAGMHGADFLCYLTSKEHIGLPNPKEVREGIIVTRIAAHIADIARGNQRAILEDLAMSEARKNFNWNKIIEYNIDPKNLKELIKKELRLEKGCSMCGADFCALMFRKSKKKSNKKIENI